MNRIDSPTAEADTHGAGKDGFTDGDPGNGIPPTFLNGKWCNAVQEETCRAIEGNGDTLDEDTYSQLDDAVQGMSRVVAARSDARYVLQGLTFDLTGTSLTIPLAAGEFVFDGRRYVVTADKLSDAGHDSWTLAASRDHYFYLAPEDPDAPSTPPDRTTVYVERLDVANGAGAPGTPAGTVLFAKVVTNGTDATSVTYYSRGPRMVAENGASLALRPAVGSTTAALVPNASNAVDLGHEDDVEAVTGRVGTVYSRTIDLKTTTSSLFSYFRNRRYTGITTTTGGGSASVNISDVVDTMPDGAAAYVEVRGVAFDLSDPTDSYSFRIECHVHRDGANLELDGSGLAPAFEDGNGAIAAGVTVAFDVSTGTLRLQLTGHNTDALRWAFEVHVFVAGDS